MDKDVLRGLSEKEVEIEHLKTTVVALSQKIELMKDLEKDVENHQVLSQNHKQKRVEMQNYLLETSNKIAQEASDNKAF